jgi:hypothetical protein
MAGWVAARSTRVNDGDRVPELEKQAVHDDRDMLRVLVIELLANTLALP